MINESWALDCYFLANNNSKLLLKNLHAGDSRLLAPQVSCSSEIFWLLWFRFNSHCEKQNPFMFTIVFWDVLPCKIIVDRRFRGTYCLHHQGSTSQMTIVNIILAAMRTWNLTKSFQLGGYISW
jgi:hypothetical protein